MTEKYNQDFENSTKYWIWDNAYFDGDLKVKDHCHIAGKFRGSALGYCNINVKLKHKIPVLFHYLKNYDFYLSRKN